jgi:hypothetical protein
MSCNDYSILAGWCPKAKMAIILVNHSLIFAIQLSNIITRGMNIRWLFEQAVSKAVAGFTPCFLLNAITVISIFA